MAVVLNKGTQALIDNFISTYFSNIPSENRAKIKESVVEIADSILEQSNKDLDKLATKGDLDKIESRFEVKLTETKYDLLKWIITAQVAIAGFLLAVIKFT